MAKLLLPLACVVAALSVVRAAVPADQVTSLPGWNKPLPSKHYSGYFPVASGKGMLHYWFIESENDPSSDPVVMWLNGGPGSSSLIGLLTENGQFQTNDDSLNGTKINLIYNPYSWSKVANVLYLEQPKGVGFSYCTTPSCVNTDESVGQEAADFLEAFFKAYSEYATNDFYITGESYAGIYIPEIMSAIDARGTLNLKGAAIGDGCWGNEVGTCGTSAQSDRISVEFYNGHGMIPQPLYDSIKAACGNFTTPLSASCKQLVAQMDSVIGNFDIYNIYDQCGNDQVSARAIMEQLRASMSFNTSGMDSFRTHPQLKPLSGALNDYACGAEKVMESWLAQPSVQAALHVSKTGTQLYERTAKDLRPMYKTLAQKYRVLIYSGDVDGCVPYWGSEEWTRELGFPQKEAWRPWNSPSSDEPTQGTIKAGYVTTYTAGNQVFTFLTVNGAGHLVPQHKPAQALTMITRFLKNEPF